MEPFRMTPEKEQKLSDVFRFLGEQQIKLYNLIDRVPEEVCQRCGNIPEECNCDEYEII